MPDIYHSLLGHDLGHLQIIAELWGLEIRSNDPNAAVKELAAALLEPERIAEVIDSLTPSAREAIQVFLGAGGRIPYAACLRQFGDIREMGTGKRDREHPHQHPSSTSEVLFYRALIGRAFFDTEKGPQEFAYIPDDLLELIQSGTGGTGSAPVTDEPPGRPALPAERKHILAADDRILDDATTLLAALRLGQDVTPEPKLISLLHAADLLKKNVPQAEAVRKFLEASRSEALRLLVQAWQESGSFNELRLMPQIICEGEWKNDPLATRGFISGLLGAIPKGRWWNLEAFVGEVKKRHPDFQRPAGDYDSWFIKRKADDQYLRGFASWDEVDGALIRFFITDILYWLGMVELAKPEEGKEITAFRWLNGDGTKGKVEDAKLQVTSQGKIIIPRLAPRAVRYQIARFCEWDGEKQDEYKYHLTPHSLRRAGEQALKVEQLLTLLAKHSDAGIPPVLVKALKRWEANGTEARAETQVVLKVSRPEVLDELRKSKAARFLGEPLGPTTVTVKSGAVQKVMGAMTELGLLAEDNTDLSLRAAGETNDAAIHSEQEIATSRKKAPRNDK